MCMETNLFEYFGLDREDSDRVFIIAEMSANHNHDFNIAVATVKAAKAAGADAIKLQTYTADTLTLDCDNAYFQIKQDTLWDGTTLYKLYQNAFTPWKWQPELKRIAEEEGLICFSSPFDKTSVDFLEAMDVPAYKIASFEITDIPLIEYVASKMKPVIISTLTRVQRERFTDLEEYERVKNVYILRNDMLRNSRENLRILHPLPRVNEIAYDVDDNPKAYYIQQARNGLFARQAIICEVLGISIDE